MQTGLPVRWNPPCGARDRLSFRVRVRRRQFRTLNHSLLLVIKKPIFTGFKAGNHRMSCSRRMSRCMLARRTVTASDMPAFSAPAEVEPPPFGG
jgi:hypothetical protein